MTVLLGIIRLSFDTAAEDYTIRWRDHSGGAVTGKRMEDIITAVQTTVIVHKRRCNNVCSQAQVCDGTRVSGDAFWIHVAALLLEKVCQ